MTRRMKSFISLLLCICMFVGTLPDSMIQAFAEETGTQQEEGESVMAEVSGLGESATEEDTEYLDQSVTVDISAAQVDGKGDALTTALTGETLTAVVSAYNDNPNYEAEATIRIYVEQTSGNSTIALTEIPDEITLSGSGSSDKASAVTVEAKWYAVDDADNKTGIPYLEFSIPSGASAVFNLTLECPTGYDTLATAQIYADVIETTDEETNTTKTTRYPSEDSSDYLTFTWTGEAEWDNFTKTASLDAIGVSNGVIKADEVDWTFSADNNTTGSVGVVYTNYITMSDTLTLPEGLSVSGGKAVLASDSSSGTIKTTAPDGKIVVGEVQNGDDEVAYAIFLDDAYEDYYTFSMSLVTDSAGNQTGITYTITIENPDATDVTKVSFNPVSAISAAIYLGELTLAQNADLTGKSMENTAELTVYSVMEDGNGGYEVLYPGKDDSEVKFDTEMTLGVEKTVYQVTDGIGNVTYGEGLDTSVGTTLSNEKKDSDGTPYVAQGYTVTYQVTVSSTFAKTTDATMTDTLPSELTLDENSIVVRSGDSELVSGTDYSYETSKAASGETTLTVTINAVPANGSVVIQYSCTVNDTATTANTKIENVAAVGDRTASATVKTPADGYVEISREIIRRTTKTTTGNTVTIYKDLDSNTYKYDSSTTTSTALLEYFGTDDSNLISSEELEDAILKVNAGDTVEYLITVENNSLKDVNGTIYESNLFSSVVESVDTKIDTSTTRLPFASASAKIGANAGGWNYYIVGLLEYLHTEVDSTDYTVSRLSAEDIAEDDVVFKECIYTYHELEDKSSGERINQDNRNGVWKFLDDSHALKAYTTYHQTTIVEIPGENTTSSADTTNAGYQNLVSSYAYYCTSYYENYKGTWNDYAFFVPNDSTSTSTGDTIYTDIYAHTPERQIYLNTGTLASTVLTDTEIENISTKDGQIQELLYKTSTAVIDANDYTNSSKYFTADENSVVVNYVYLFNDSSETMNLNDYSLSVILPDGFEWVGFTYSMGESTDDDTGYVYRTYSKISDSVLLSTYYTSNYDLWVNNSRATSSQSATISDLAYSSGLSSGYYAGNSTSFSSTYSQMTQEFNDNNLEVKTTDSPEAGLTCTTTSKQGAIGEITFSFSGVNNPTIAAYSGIVVMYVAKVSNASEVKETYSGTNSNVSNAAATFQTYIKRTKITTTKYNHEVKSSSYCMSQISPVIRAQDAASSPKIASLGAVYRQRVSNDGNANTFLNHKLDDFYSVSSSTVAGGTGKDDKSQMWSYVSLSMYVETTSVSVTKEVWKNSGEEKDGEYSNGVIDYDTGLKLISSLDTTNKLTGGFGTSDYNTSTNYNYGYSLLDGLHRTVDGTVTWKVTIENTGDFTDPNSSTSASEGAVYNYSTVDYSTLVETIDSPYHLIEVAVPNLYYTKSTPSRPYYTYKNVYFELPDADPSSYYDMTNAGWIYDKDSDSYYYEVYARGTGTAYSSGSLLTNDLETIQYIKSPVGLCMRVTVRCLENGSVASGYDVDSGNQNTCAYQYLIEFCNPLEAANNNNYPLLYTASKVASDTNLSSSVEMYLTFSTDDSIETNYNSFGLVLKDVKDLDDVKLVDDADDVTIEDGENGEVTTVSEMHKKNNSSSSSSGGTITTTYTPYTGAASSPGTIDANAVVVQANDWTDTSYTYGEKTITVYDDDGNVATDDDGKELTINTMDEGNMILPSSVSAGTAIHGTLKWESVLYQSEYYSSVTDLVLYDTYGLQAGTKATSNTEDLCGYDVDLSSITVQLCLSDDITNNTGLSSTDDGFNSTVLKVGEDYEIYYTTAALVTDEHLSLTVNSLELAADLNDLDTVTWLKYDLSNLDDPDCGDGTGAMAFKIVFLENGKAGTIWNAKYPGNESYSNWSECEIYVDYDAVVSDSVVEGTEYPNVLAWTAKVIQPEDTANGRTYAEKGIAQDTTALIFEAAEVSYPTLSKAVVDESDTDISSQITSEEFTYLIFRTNQISHSKSNLSDESNIEGVAAVTIQAGKTLTLNDSNLDILYSNYDTDDDSAKAFWDTSDDSTYYYIVEIDSGNYEEKSISISDDKTNVTGGTASSLTIGSMSSAVKAIEALISDLKTAKENTLDAEELADMEAQIELYESIKSYLSTDQTASKAAYFAITDTSSSSGGTSASGSSLSWSVTIEGVNKYTAPKLVIYKTDTYGTRIMNAVTFRMQNADGKTLCFTETSGGYSYAGIYDSTNTTGVTADLVFNGTTSVTGLPEGTYYLEETNAPTNYKISTEKTKFEIVAERDDTSGKLVTEVSVTVTNEADTNTVSGSVKLLKVDAATDTAITTGSAYFKLYSSNKEGSEPITFVQDEDSGGKAIAGSYTYSDSTSGTLVTTISTDSSTGILELSGLPTSTYYLVETLAPDGYEASHASLDDAYVFEISQTQSEIEIDFPNTYIQADIVITKTDENGDAITGNPASFTLTDTSGTEVKFSKVNDGIYAYDESGSSGSVTTLETSSDGTLTLQDLPKDIYTLTETNAPKGYSISTDPLDFTVSSSGQQFYTVKNETASMRLRIAKTWKYEGRTATYAFSGVNFTLYQASSDGTTASEVASGTTNGSGILDLDGLDWSKVYYLYEEVPTGYSTSTTSGTLVMVYRNDTSGKIDLNVTESTDGYTAIECILINMSENLCSKNSSGEYYCTDVNGTWTYTQNILNVKNETYGGMYASTAYKTISNAKSAAKYDDLEEQTGYSYFYLQKDYDADNYNYVSAVKAGDTVTYTLNISNVSDSEFSNLVIIDRMPEEGDTGIVNRSASRGSEFAVINPANIVVMVDGVEVSSNLYTISYSTKTKFTNSDFNGTTSWSDTASSSTESFRIVFDSTFTLNPSQTLVVTYDGVIGDDAEIGEKAWNNFAYRYTASSGSKEITLTPEPPKVGVYIQGESYKVTKVWEDDDDSLELRPSSVTLQLQMKDKNGNLTDVDKTTVKLTYAKDSGGTESLTAELVTGNTGTGTNSTVEVEASLDDNGNWICKWTGLPALVDSCSYVVEEIDTGNANYIWSFEQDKDANGGIDEECGTLTNTLQFTTLNLVKQNGDGETLEGTQFSLEIQTGTDSLTGEAVWKIVDSLYSLGTDGSITKTELTSDMLTTDADGKVTIAGLIAGTYRITEVKSNDGYTLLSDPLVIELPVSYTETEVTSKKIDTTGSDVYLIGSTYYFYNVTYTITNTANFTMPSAGQTAGSVWISGLFGALLLAGAWMFLLHRRRVNHLINHPPDTP